MDMMMLFLGAGVIAVIGGLFYLVYLFEKKRTESLRSLCLQRGFRFTEKPEIDGSGFDLFSLGRSKRSSNLMEGNLSKVDFKVFDYKYTIGGGKSQRTVKQTVAITTYENLQAPDFTLGPESVFHKIGDLFTKKDIDFEGFPGFSGKYHLKGEDERALRNLFSPNVLKYFEGIPKPVTIEVKNQKALLYFPGKRLKPDEIPEFIENVARTVKALSISG